MNLYYIIWNKGDEHWFIKDDVQGLEAAKKEVERLNNVSNDTGVYYTYQEREYF